MALLICDQGRVRHQQMVCSEICTGRSNHVSGAPASDCPRPARTRILLPLSHLPDNLARVAPRVVFHSYPHTERVWSKCLTSILPLSSLKIRLLAKSDLIRTH